MSRILWDLPVGQIQVIGIERSGNFNLGNPSVDPQKTAQLNMTPDQLHF
jgi:hypothetical protein